MPTTDEIMDKAKALGEEIAEHEAAKAFIDSLSRLEKDTEAQRAVTDLNRYIGTLSQKQQAGSPIEVEDKRKLEELQTAVVMHPVLRAFQTAQVEYVDLLRKVDEAMIGQTNLPEPDMSGGGDAGGPGAGGPGGMAGPVTGL